MPNKIFISYNHNDKILIDTIARRLELEFGRNNIFYDAWSIQPGDSIIGKMNEGLGDFKTFFFFVSPNSLQSKMVSLEWQTALNRAVNEQLKFVAVRIADCKMPAILMDKAYIDLYGEGLDDAVEKMRLVINGENTYKPLENVKNLLAEINPIDDYNIDVTIRAQYFAEHMPTFAFACLNEYDDFSVNPYGGMYHVSQNTLIPDNSNIVYHAHIFGLTTDLKPKFPFKVRIKRLKENRIIGFCVYILTDNENGYLDKVPCVVVNKGENV